MTSALIPLLVLVAVAGLAVGSFLNVVIYRIPRDESLVSPGSHCPTCDAAIKTRHILPVLSWVALRGRCASCSAGISPRYPLVELATAVLFVLLTLHFGITPELPAFLYLGAVTVALAMIDLDVHRLPDAIVLPSYLVAGLLLVPAAVAGGDNLAAVRAIGAMTAMWLFYFAIHAVNPHGMGFGDVKLAGLIGLYLGWLGWSSVLVGAFAGFLLGSLAGTALMALRRAGRRTAIPFGPAMLSGAILALFLSAPVTDWYGSFTGLTA